MKKYLQTLLLSGAVLLPGMIYAGNIGQYKFKKSGEEYSRFDDGAVIGGKLDRTNLTPSYFIFPDGTETNVSHKAAGYPIGFDFRFGGTTVNQFICSSNGVLILGKDEIDYKGRGGAFVEEESGYENPMQLAMSPIKCGVYSGSMSYKTTGEAGNRVCTVQFDKMMIQEIGQHADHCGIFSLQVRLFEKDGRVEFAMYEDRTVWENNGFFVGLQGWDHKDQIFLTANGLDSAKTSVVVGKNYSMLDPSTFVYWDNMDADNYYSPTFSFTPADDTPCVAAAPKNLKLEQDGDDVIITCEKSDDADATLIAYSLKPFTDADLPANGVSYRVKNNGEFCSKLGDATVLYYHNDKAPKAVISNVPESTTLYVRAYSVNGYPNYNTKDFAQSEIISTQLPPTGFYAGQDAQNVKITWNSDDDVIIAKTTKHYPYLMEAYEGSFERPEADVKVGDKLDDAAEVIFVGKEKEFVFPIDKIDVNYPTFFKIWSVRDGVVSALGADSYVVPAVTFPYEPRFEEWPIGLVVDGWVTEMPYAGPYPTVRDGDDEPTLLVIGVDNTDPTIADKATEFHTPEIEFDGKRGALELTFDFAVETFRDAAAINPGGDGEGEGQGPVVELPQGCEPGWFGEVNNAGFAIYAGEIGEEKEIGRITEYDGTMTETEAGYVTGTSTYKPYKVTVPAINGKGMLKFSLCTKKQTQFYIKNFRIDYINPDAVEEVAAADGLRIEAGNGVLSAVSDSDRMVEVFNVAGMKVAALSLKAGVKAEVALPAGLYIASGRKFVVK